MNWLAAILGAIRAILGLFKWIHDRDVAEAAVAKAKLQGTQNEDDAIAAANAAREAVRADLARGADPMSDDGFRRAD